ncbi:ABC transporter ATP-binding protein [uncultured Christiangramia sp.]|uniref:ABC transporter ATP-binding protein n=1 Tax=uncultured Christiangramia sp. TaxID=503836 RepID=UPI0026389C63|nr:ABC transporter ATP-binding protein [uncultured Christiangramia sp.]
MSVILKAENISKQYRLGTVGTGSLQHDLNRWWHKIRGMQDPYLKVGGVNDRSAKATEDYVWALRDINFEVKQGEVLGIIGKNGAGKSTLLKILSRVTAPTTGSIKTKGRIASLLEVGTGFHGELTGRENIFMNGAVLGMSRNEIKSKLDEIIAFSGCEKYIDTPVKRYSSGMTVRLGFAVAAHLEPEILVVDEVLAVGDAEFQKKAIGKMQDLSTGEGRTVLFVSHNMVSVQKLCTNCLVLENGSISFSGNTEDSIRQYLADKKIEYKFSNKKRKVSSYKAKIKNMFFKNEKGEIISVIMSGQKVFLEIEIQIESILGLLAVGVGFYDQNNIPQFHCSTETISKNYDVKNSNRNFTAKLEINKWPLNEGEFFINSYLREPSQLLEHIEECLWFTSKKGDFFNTGKLPSWNKGFYCSYDWK